MTTETPPEGAAPKITHEDYDLFRAFLEEACGIDLGTNKMYLVTSRLGGLMVKNNIQSMPQMVELMKKPGEGRLKEQVIDAMTTNETNWFRDTHPYEVMKNRVLPEYKKNRSLRIWSAASSSGQEAYTISIAISEFLRTNAGAFPEGVEIKGTDISPSMLDKAKEGIYDSLEMGRGLSDDRRRQFFEKLPDGRMRVREQERKRVNFRQLNLLNSFILLGRFDIIFCRNVLIYFQPDVKLDIVNRMAGSLNTNGYLFLGASEPLSEGCALYEMINCNPGLVYKKK